MAEIIDLRAYPRFGGDGIVAQIGQEIVEIMDISVAGVRLVRPSTLEIGRHIGFRIIPFVGDDLDFNRAVPVWGHVVGDECDHLRITFAAVTTDLANIIGYYAGERAGSHGGMWHGLSA